MVRTAVLGAGPAGERHARALRAWAGRCELVGVHDPDHATAVALAERLGVPAVENPETLMAQAEAAVVSTPVDQRTRLTRAALERGLDVLVEPPVGHSPDDAHSLLSAIVRAPRRPVAMVAHADHHDPTVRALRTLVDDQRIVAVHSERMDPALPGPAPELDVVNALMLHDLQIVLALSNGGSIAATQAVGRRLRLNGALDHAQALLVMDDDLVASLVVSRASHARVRRVHVTTTMAQITADLDLRRIEAVRTTSDEQGRRESVAQRIDVPADDAVVALADAFLRHVERRTAPELGIGTGIACQEAALAILKRIELVAHRPALRHPRAAA
jgi:predicted dehydrogenase